MGKRIAVISDIHGNHFALSKVLEDIEKSDVDEVFCLGDIVSLGHQTNEVMNALKRKKNIIYIRGNHDDEVVKAYKGEPSDIKGAEQDHHLYIAGHIHEGHLKMLEALPLTEVREVSGIVILMVHYHLAEDGMYQSIDYKPALASLEKYYNNSRYDVILFGHDHMSLHLENDSRLFMNPGALGITADAFSPYAVMDIGDDGSVDFELKKIPYDRDSFVRELRKKNPPALDFILKELLKEEG